MDGKMHLRWYHVGIILGPVLFSPAFALQIRSYSATRHDRFTGFPASPVLNTSSWYPGTSYTGVGWSVSDPRKQFALITPQHVAFAEHFKPGIGDTIRFLGAAGVVVDRTVTATTNIQNSSSQATDLTICTLSAPIPASTGITPFPYLNLMTNGAVDESLYSSYALTIFGMQAKVGSGNYTLFVTPDGFTTRTAVFQYTNAFGGQDDCYVEDGDSGSPTFATGNTAGHKFPALVGLHYLMGQTTATHLSFDTFVPTYITESNAFLKSSGYRMIPSNASSVTLSVSATTTPTTLRQANAGSTTLSLANSTAALTGNVRLTLSFPSGSAPASLTPSDADWVVESSTPTTWVLRRATLAASSSASVVANWTTLPLTASIPITCTKESDGYAAATQTVTLTLGDSYNAWANGLSDTSQAGDPDNDGISNLVEYAFGSSGASGSAVSASGVALVPVMKASAGTATLEFPVRSDATARGITYSVEYSQTLESASWSTTPPSGLTTTDAAYSPAWPGFNRRQISFPVTAQLQFARVKILLNE